MRQHVNPLSSFFQLPLELPKPEHLFEIAQLPIHLDIGSARGRFLLEMAHLNPERNFLGVEIREPLVLAAERDRRNAELTNLSFLFCNANISLETWLSLLQVGQLEIVSIQFPDPWFKRRHKKRRVLQPALLIALAKALKPGSSLFIQSDVIAVFEHMASLIDLSNCFSRSTGDKYFDRSPFPVATEREKFSLSHGQEIYRAFYTRNAINIPSLSDLTIKYNGLNNILC